MNGLILDFSDPCFGNSLQFPGGHSRNIKFSFICAKYKTGAPGRIRTCHPRLRTTTVFTAMPEHVCGLDHIFAVSGMVRMASTDPHELHKFPRYCHFTGFTDTAPSTITVSFPVMGPRFPPLEGRCSIRMSYERIKKLVGVEGFEPPTTCSQSRCATRLRYTPNISNSASFRCAESIMILVLQACVNRVPA